MSTLGLFPEVVIDINQMIHLILMDIDISPIGAILG